MSFCNATWDFPRVIHVEPRMAAYTGRESLSKITSCEGIDLKTSPLTSK